MANTCSTYYKCVGDPSELKQLLAILESTSKPFLCTILEKMGVNLKDLSEQGLGCRGSIIWYEYDGDRILSIDQETAWCEQEGFRRSIEKVFPSVKVYYLEEEPGCDVFYTNDPNGEFFPQRFLLDSPDVYEFFENIEDVIDYLQEKFHISVEEQTESGIQSAIDRYAEERDDDFWMYIHEFKYSEN